MFEQLTGAQQEIIEMYGKNILKSCPGSGKTFVVAHKVAHDLRLWKYKNKGMAILSFTNVAKRELEAKIQEVSGLKALPYPHFIGTLDSFISQYIFMPFGQIVMKCLNRPSIIDDNFIAVCVERYWRKECYSNRCSFNDFHIDTNRIVFGNKNNFAKCPFTNNRPCENLKFKMYSKGFATYKEMLIVAIDLIKKHSAIRRLIVKRFPYFIVDEAQDTSREQMELLNLLFDNDVESAMLIGDPDQAIYEWRDAEPDVFLELYDSTNWNAKELNENFRCSQHICNATKIFSSLSDTSIASGNTKNSAIKPVIMKYDKGKKDISIERYLELCKKEGINISPEKVAVLVRGRASLNATDYSHIKDLWKNNITLLLAQATFYKGMQNIDKTVAIVEKILYYMLFDEFTNVIDTNNIQKLYSVKEWNNLVFHLSTLLPSATISLKNWRIEISSITNKFISINNIKCKGEIKIETKSRVKDPKVKDFLEQPVEVFFADNYKSEYLKATIHAVKGCTFDAVMLIVDTNGKLTSNMINKNGIDTEEIRTFYVAATRAKKIFVLALPSTVRDNSLVRFPIEHWDYM